MHVYTFCPYCHELQDHDTFLVHLLLDHPGTELSEVVRAELHQAALEYEQREATR